MYKFKRNKGSSIHGGVLFVTPYTRSTWPFPIVQHIVMIEVMIEVPTLAHS